MGAGSKTIVPTDAYVKLSFRLVANQDPDKILAAVDQFVTDHTPAGIDMQIEWEGDGVAPCLVPLGTPAYLALTDAISAAFDGAQVLPTREGGSGPEAALQQRSRRRWCFSGSGCPTTRSTPRTRRSTCRCCTRAPRPPRCCGPTSLESAATASVRRRPDESDAGRGGHRRRGARVDRLLADRGREGQPGAGPGSPGAGQPSGPSSPGQSGAPAPESPTSSSPAPPAAAHLACPHVVDPVAGLAYNCVVGAMTRGSNAMWPVKFEKAVDVQWTMDEGSGSDAGQSPAAVANGLSTTMARADYGPSPGVRKEADRDTTIDGKKAHLVLTVMTINPAYRKQRHLRVTRSGCGWWLSRAVRTRSRRGTSRSRACRRPCGPESPL